MNAQEKKTLRKQLYVNRDVQLELILRSILQWYFYMCAILLTVVIFTVIRDPSVLAIKLVFKSFVYFSPAIIASVILLPLFVWDVLKASNRVAGPIHRLRNEMAALAAGRDVKELRFREGDHWSEIAEEFNVLAQKLMSERKAHDQTQAPLNHASQVAIG